MPRSIESGRRHSRRQLQLARRRQRNGRWPAGPPENRPGISPALCQPAMPSLQTSVSARDGASGDEVAQLGFRERALLLA